jgi:hypothetical protein
MDKEEVCRLAQSAVTEFGTRVFWSIPGFRIKDLAAAKTAAEMLRKHGGLKGWQKSQEIEDALNRVSEENIKTPGGE